MEWTSAHYTELFPFCVKRSVLCLAPQGVLRIVPAEDCYRKKGVYIYTHIGFLLAERKEREAAKQGKRRDFFAEKQRIQVDSILFIKFFCYEIKGKMNY